MGVDYYAHSGIGFLVRVPKKFQDDEDFDLYSHLDEVLINSEYAFFETGQGAYTGEDNDFYVVLESFKPLDDLNQRSESLKSFLIQHDLIDATDEYDLVGGLQVC